MGERLAQDHHHHQLHVAFLPYPAPGHTIPMLDMVRLMSARKVRTTVITTPLNAPNVTKHLNITNENLNRKTNNNAFLPNIHIIPFPSHELTGLPQGVENQGCLTSAKFCTKFMISMNLLEDPVEQFLEKTKPNCLVSDLFFPFATNLAKKFGIPRLAFHVTGFFPMCVMMGLKQHEPGKSILSDDEPFLVPGLPHQITLTKSQLQHGQIDEAWDEFMSAAIRAFVTSFGDVYNTYYELEPDYADYYRKGHHWRKVWHIGPVSLCNRSKDEQFERGQSASICENDCIKWLDSKPPNSVIYLSFGTLTHFKDSQLKDIAIALENVGYDFVWVVRARDAGNETQNEDWLPDGFEKRMEGRGLIIRGWAPQVLILEHPALGAFVTHCGWNSALEGFSAGVPMATWPLHAEHFYIEKLITEVVKIGVQVGNKKWSSTADGTFITHEMLETTLKQIMEGQEALEMRMRAQKLRELAHKAVDEGGSSHCDLTNLIQDLVSYSP